MADMSRRTDGEETRRTITDALRSLRTDGKRPTARELAAFLKARQPESSSSHTNIRSHLRALKAQGIISMEEVPSHSVRQEIVLTEHDAPPTPDAVRP